MEIAEGVILGAGNPLLDLIVNVPKEFLDKWGLKENNSTPCTDERIFEEIEHFSPKHVPGGTIQNTAFVFQWILGEYKKRFTVLGTIGNDQSGQKLMRQMATCGVNAHYEISSLAPTGKCAVLINGQNRSMCTFLGASKLFSSTILSNPTVLKLVEKAKYFYLSCQFFNACADFIQRIGEHSLANGKIFCLNLGSPLAQKRFRHEIDKILPFVNIIFGNREEILAFGEVHNLESNVEAIMLSFSQQKTVVVTQANDPVVVVQKGDISHYSVVDIPKEQIRDTSGAGDAFVGGFLSQYVQGKSLEVCVKCGCYASSEIIQQYGCSPPAFCNWE